MKLLEYEFRGAGHVFFSPRPPAALGKRVRNEHVVEEGDGPTVSEHGASLPALPESAAFHTIASLLPTVSVAYRPAGIFNQKKLR